MSTIVQRGTNYRRLRADYDIAFQQLALELQSLNQLEAQNGVEGSAAYRCYLRRRNDLADFLLSRRTKARIVPPIPDTPWRHEIYFS